ncbi:MAG: hypothetical protein J0I43_14295 [Microbacterium sp.]|uniref:DUF6541 family protein n=1 Tax=Microbacterium sp. TaxID=51671 RepID=UPI001AD27B2F|nr:DUF6541 family protein [Microbacterium sp.]MBN9178519.1 hypothetical protein [Microbacterium sp.]
MTFVPLLPPVLTAIALLWGLGGFLSWAVGLRGYWAVAAAPAFAVTLAAGTAVVGSWLHIPWSVIPVIAMTGTVGLAIFLLRRGMPGNPGVARRRGSPWLPASLAVAALVVAWRVSAVMQAPENISQTFDNIFHLNAVRFILTEGDASSLHLGTMTSPDGSLPFYPAAWHGIVALIVQLTGVSIPIAVNALVFTVSAAVWPLAAVLLVRTLFGSYAPYTVAAALLSASVPVFPILLMDYGVLYPLQLSLAILPIALAATLRVLRIVPQVAPRGTWWWTLILVGVIPGLALAHPGGFVAWLALTLPMVAFTIWRALRGSVTMRRRLSIVLGGAGYLAIGAVLVRVLRPPAEARGWPLQTSMLGALSQVLGVSMWYLVPAFVVAAAAVAGIVWSLVDHTPRAVLALSMYLVAAGLFIAVAALPLPALRDALTGSWYNNLPRLAAIFGVALVPLAAYGAGRTWLAIMSRRPALAVAPRRSVARSTIGVAAAAVLLIGLQADGTMQRAVDWASGGYRLDAASPLLNSDEYALLQRLPDEVPEGVTVAGSPWTGASLAFAISDRPVLMPHTLMYISDEMATVNDELDVAQRGDAVCAALTDLGVGYVLDFGRAEVHPGAHPFPGLDDLATSSAVELVDREGDAKLYRIVACG